MSERQRRQRAFRAARRHSRLVRRLRLLLPAAAVLSVGAFVGVTRLALPDNLDLSAARLSVTSSAIIMDRPHLKGFGEANKEFSVLADRAEQSLSNPDALRLDNITATIGRDGRVRTTLKAETGDYDRGAQRMQLHGAIAIDSVDGYSVRMTDADIDLAAGTVVSPNPALVTNGPHKTTGRSVAVSGGGDVVVLSGQVRTTLIPQPRGPRLAGPVAGQAVP